MRSAGGYDVGYDECFCTTDFATAPGSLDIACVFNDMVPTADNQPKQHTFSMPTSRHSSTSSLRRADVGSVGGYDIGYD